MLIASPYQSGFTSNAIALKDVLCYRVILYYDRFTSYQAWITVHICFTAVCMFPKAIIVPLSCILLYSPGTKHKVIQKHLLVR